MTEKVTRPTRREVMIGAAAAALLPALPVVTVALSAEPVGEFVYSLDGEGYSWEVFSTRALALAAAAEEVREEEIEAPGEAVTVFTGVPRWINSEEERPEFAEDWWAYWTAREQEHEVIV